MLLRNMKSQFMIFWIPKQLLFLIECSCCASISLFNLRITLNWNKNVDRILLGGLDSNCFVNLKWNLGDIGWVFDLCIYIFQLKILEIKWNTIFSTTLFFRPNQKDKVVLIFLNGLWHFWKFENWIVTEGTSSKLQKCATL